MTPGRLTALALAAGALAACKSEEPRTPEEPIAVEATEVEDAGEAPKLQLQEPLLADMGEHPVRMGRICLTQGTEELEATGSPGEAESQEGPVILGKVDLSEGSPDNGSSSSGPAATDEAGPKRPPKRRVMLGSPAPPRPKE